MLISESLRDINLSGVDVLLAWRTALVNAIEQHHCVTSERVWVPCCLLVAAGTVTTQTQVTFELDLSTFHWRWNIPSDRSYDPRCSCNLLDAYVLLDSGRIIEARVKM